MIEVIAGLILIVVGIFMFSLGSEAGILYMGAGLYFILMGVRKKKKTPLLIKKTPLTEEIVVSKNQPMFFIKPTTCSYCKCVVEEDDFFCPYCGSKVK